MSDYAAYCFYVNRPDLLKRAVESFPDLWSELTIVDNSRYGVDTELPASVSVWEPPVPLTYTQSMNWMLKDALSHGVDFILHFHSDAVSSNPTAVQELLSYVRQCKAEGRQWGLAWTFYDILFALNPQALQDVGGWDTVFPAYFSDNDLRRRLTLAGWECIDTHIQGLGHEGSATINSDEKLKFINGATFPMYGYYYQLKHGGEPGHETFTAPFDRNDLFGINS